MGALATGDLHARGPYREQYPDMTAADVLAALNEVCCGIAEQVQRP
jgi:hypothetical protein